MEQEQSLNHLNENDKAQDRAWTIDEIRRNSSNWTLAGDIGLFNLLNEFSHHIISQTHEVENAVDSLVHQTKMASAKINNIINDFHMLSNLQFVENRVYDEEIQESSPEVKTVEKTKEQKEAEMLPKIIRAVELGLLVLDKAFDKINVNEISDSEDEDISSEGRTILEPKDPYEHRPLPFIIGSEEFQNSDYAGLQDLLEEEIESSVEEASSISESDDTSSEEEPLPLDDRFSEKQSERRQSQSISDKISSSDESELFGSEKEENGFVSDSSFETKMKEGKNIQRTNTEVKAKEKDSRQNSVSSLQSKLNLPQVLPVPKSQISKKDDLFMNDDEISDDDSPFRKRTGLFASEIRFDEEKDDTLGSDLFTESMVKDSEEKVDGKQKSSGHVEKKKDTPIKKALAAKSDKPVLFDQDEDSEDDIFNTLIKTKKSAVPTENNGSQDSSEKAESLSTPSSAPSLKPSGNAFDFVTGADSNALFGDESDADDLFSNKKSLKKFDFDDLEDDDLFGETSHKTTKSTMSSKKDEKTPTIKAPSRVKESLFGDSDSSDQDVHEPIVKKVSDKPLSIPEKKHKVNLFDDDDDDADDYIFSEINKKTVSNKSSVENKLGESLFDSLPKNTATSKEITEEKKEEKLNLLDDALKQDQPRAFSGISTKTQQKALSLFEDSDSFDLFAPKATEMKIEAAPAQKDIPNLAQKKTMLPTEVESDGSILSSEKSMPETQGSFVQVGFDVPIDSSNTLNVINKDRVKIVAKRRKPTRKGRLAALEPTEKDNNAIAHLPENVKSSESEKTDELFSSVKSNEPPVLSYQAQEKKKMNLMSQLITEVAASKVGRKVVVEDNDDEVDIFSEILNTNQSKKQSFTFLSPKENSIKSVFPSETKEEIKNTVESHVEDSDDLENDFFAEPSFQNFRSSISQMNPPLNLDDEEDDDDLFSTIKSDVLPKAKTGISDQDIFDDDTDIFADIHREKYEMFPSQLYDNEDDDIFGNMDQSSTEKANSISDKTASSSSIKKVEKKHVDAFEDPLTGLLGDD